MLTLFQFAPALGLPSSSPFCLKLETFLRLAGLDYRTEVIPGPRAAPKGKLPFIEDGEVRLSDSALIIEHLRRTSGIDLDRGLSPAERAAARAIAVMLEEHLYFAMLYSRWIDDAFWPAVRDAYFERVPAESRAAVTDPLREGVRQALHGQGMGRHTPEEIYALGAADIDALADWLGDKPFVMGETPTTVDATAYAFAANLLVPPLDTPLRRAAARHPNLVRYVERLTARAFPTAKAA